MLSSSSLSSLLQKSLACKSILTKACFSSESLATTALGKAKKKGKGAMGGASSEKIQLPVETDTNRLVNYVCGTNLLKEGGEDVKIGPDSDYPEWLYEIYTGPERQLADYEPGSLDYWRRVHKLQKRKNNKMAKLWPNV